MRKLIIILLTILASLLSGCANLKASETAAKAKTKLIGMPKESILQCMGVARNIQSAGNTEVWEYYTAGTPHTTVNFYNNTNGNNQYGYGTATTTQRNCKIDIIFINGTVSNINYSGNTGGILTKNYQCAEAVRNCI